ncbi:MAG TPA: GNAT family N-acetyltransferase [Meiothermus sp.]|jgi:ribosomal protein S18 acetylase RimI-like enzyme|nr:GNAT family N-acetyltransferase [Meiothermus sp.]
MSVHTRPYYPADEAACLKVFDSNVPKYFSTEEREEFKTFLKLPSCVYLVLEQSGQIVGCGGYYVHQEGGQGDLCWGMVRRELHGTGLGKRLLLERLGRIVQNPQVTSIRLDTSQHTRGFFAKLGFVTLAIVPNGYGPSLDRYNMRLSLDEAARKRIQTACQEVQP